MEDESTHPAGGAGADMAASGIAGLDEILRGGFARGDVHLVQGSGGTGKTTLALQFLLAGVRAGEHTLYVSLSQSRRVLERIARSHGWSLAGMHVHELRAEGFPQTVLHTADVELEQVVRELVGLVEQQPPGRVVFDSAGVLYLLAGSPQRYHDQVVRLTRLLEVRGCTTLFVDDVPSDAAAPMPQGLQALMGSVLLLEATAPDYGEVRRRLRVLKARGVPVHGGHHNFALRTGGIEVYPRLGPRAMRGDAGLRLLPSGVAGLDALLGGGLEEGASCVVVGPPGSGKSTLCTAFACAAARRGEHAAILLFEERPETFVARSAALGLDLRPHLSAGLVTVRQFDTADVSPGEFSHAASQAAEAGQAKVVVIDGLTGYFNAMPNDLMLVAQMHELLNFLGRRGVLTLLAVSQDGFTSVGQGTKIDLSYLADAIVLLRQFEAGGLVRRCVAAVKKRAGSHETSLRELLLGPGQVEVSEPLTQFRRILSGEAELVGRGAGG